MKRLIFAVMLWVCTFALWAVPAKRITITVKQPDGTMLALTQRGDEHFHYLMTEDGIMVKPNGKAYYYADIVDGNIVASRHLAHTSSLRSNDELRIVESLPKMKQFREVAIQRQKAMQHSRAPQKVAEVPSTGEVRVPVLLVQYSDVKFSSNDPKAAFEGHINGEDYKDEGGHGSVREYFVDQSEGKFKPQFDIIGPITLSLTMKDYGGNDENGNDKNPRGMIKEACQKADVDFSQYDNNGDGYVDIVYVIYAGYGEASYPDQLENTIWPHQWELETALSLDGVKIAKYACNNELDGYQGAIIDGIGTFCHEFSHCLGLPDFYPTGDDQTPFGMESWSLMHYGNYNNNGRTPCGYTGYELDFLGWRELIVIDEPMDVKLTALSEGGKAYKIVNDENPNEYYVVESHKRSGWDSFAPAEGMLVLHVDYLESAWQNNIVNDYVSHQRMTIIPADNKSTKETQSGDTYPGVTGNTALTSSSTPAAKVFTGGYMGKDITDISIQDGVVTFSFMKGALGIPVLDGPHDVNESGFSITWDKVPGIKEYEVSLAMLVESPYMLEENFDKVEKGNSDISRILDSYTIEPGWQGFNVFGLDRAIRVGKPSEEGILVSPTLECDSSKFTVLFTIKKSEKSDKDGFMLMGVGDEAWGNKLFSPWGIPVENEEWETYYVVMDTIGKSSFLYLDTRDNPQTPTQECLRVDIDDIYLLAGDYTEEFSGDNAPRKVPLVAPKQHCAMSAKAIASMPAKATAVKSDEKEDTGEEKRDYATTIHTTRTTNHNYRFANLDGGLYRCMVRSVRDSIYSRNSNAVEVEIVDSMLPQLSIVPELSIDNDSIYMVVDDPEVSLFYTIDGTTPTSYSPRYDKPFALYEKVTMKVVARKPGHRRTEVHAARNWFKTSGSTCRISSDITPQVYLSEGVEGNASEDYAGDYIVPTEVVYDSLTYKIIGIDTGTFRNATALRSVTIENDSLRMIGDNLFHGCSSLNAVVWNATQPISATMFDEKSYHNLLLYIPAQMKFTHPLIDEGRMTLICDGKSGTLTLNSRYPFYCPMEFTADTVSYQRSFSQTTGLGKAAGWETIVLPFDVQNYTHSTKGDIAPFGVTAQHHFWLAEWSGDSFTKSTSLRANIPYIIAMPNNTLYGNNSMNGVITFSANQTTIETTTDLTVSEGQEVNFIPTYETIAPQEDIYVLNVGIKYGENDPGSVFVPNQHTLTPFSAYMTPAVGGKAVPFYRAILQHEREEIKAFSVSVSNGTVYVSSDKAQRVEVYDMTGRRVRNVTCEPGITEIIGLHEGLYLIENVKVYVER